MSDFESLKEKEGSYLRVIRWAQRNKIKVENLTSSQILEVLRIRN